MLDPSYKPEERPTYRLHGFFTQNSLKTLYVLEELGVEFEYVFVNLSEGEQRSAAFLAMNPMGRVPVLEHDGAFLWESGAICRYLANVEESPLYPRDKLQRGRVDQWMDFFTCHLGRNLTTVFFETIIKPAAGLGETDAAVCAEARTWAKRNAGPLEQHLANNDWLANDTLSIADLFAYAYLEQCQAIEFSLADFPNIRAWLERMAARPAITRARARVQPFMGHG